MAQPHTANADANTVRCPSCEKTLALAEASGTYNRMNGRCQFIAGPMDRGDREYSCRAVPEVGHEEVVLGVDGQGVGTIPRGEGVEEGVAR
jgi:hypothetical protein